MTPDFWTVRRRYPTGTRVRLRDGHAGAVETVAYAGGLLCVWVTCRAAVPVAEIAGRA